MMSQTPIPYFISAGEPSGDLLAADLVRSLATTLPGSKAFGIVGPNMRRAGAVELKGLEDLSVMGFVEVLKHFPQLKMLEVDLLARIERIKPRFAVLVDYPGFNLRLAEQLKLRGIPVIQYVAPQLWAWGEKRTRRLRDVTDLVLGIMPFEESFFRDRQVNFQYVGTPQVDRVKGLAPKRSEFQIPEARPLFGFFPGSRKGEVERVLPVIARIQRDIARRLPEAHFIISVAPSVDPAIFQAIMLPERKGESYVSRELARTNVCLVEESRMTFARGRSLELMALSDAALVTSGTATLECALTGTPMAVAYVLHRLSYVMAKRLVTLPHISLVNLVAGRPIVNEYVQDIQVDIVAKDLIDMVQNPARRSQIMSDLSALHTNLHGDPAMHASRAIAEFIGLSPTL